MMTCDVVLCERVAGWRNLSPRRDLSASDPVCFIEEAIQLPIYASNEAPRGKSEPADHSRSDDEPHLALPRFEFFETNFDQHPSLRGETASVGFRASGDFLKRLVVQENDDLEHRVRCVVLSASARDNGPHLAFTLHGIFSRSSVVSVDAITTMSANKFVNVRSEAECGEAHDDCEGPDQRNHGCARKRRRRMAGPPPDATPGDLRGAFLMRLGPDGVRTAK